MLLVKSEKELQRVVDQFHSVCSRRKPKVNAGKSKVILFERKEVEMVNFGSSFRVSVPVDERCEIMSRGERMEVVKEFKYLQPAPLDMIAVGSAGQSCMTNVFLS